MGNMCIQNAMKEIEELVKGVGITRLSNITKKTVESLGGKSTITTDKSKIPNRIREIDNYHSKTKEYEKAKIATQFIGEGTRNRKSGDGLSSTARYQDIYKEYALQLANVPVHFL